MSRQDKATTERNARTLRDLVRQEGNKNCADCKKNDARWASWNLGVYLCIRCSGIHRSMGTHISKVKSIDLDIWQPEQMDSMKKWGNTRANLYWEAHLKPGHHPPDHKIESFIRSKYESRKWVLSDHPPRDPAVLDQQGQGQEQGEPPRYDSHNGGRDGSGSAVPLPQQQQQQQPQPSGRTTQHPLLSSMSSRPGRSTAAAAVPTPTRTQKQPEVDLLSGDFGDFSAPATATSTTAAPAVPGNRPTQAGASTTSTTTPAAPVQATSQASSKPTQPPSSSLFDLDFRPPSAASSGGAAAKTSNRDILSLFSAAPSNAGAGAPGMTRQTSGFGDFSSGGQQQQQYQQQQQQRPAVYGQESFNAPPVVQSNPQQAYASWGNGSGVTSSASPNPSAQASTAGIGAMTSGFAGMGMGSDPWSSTTTNSQGAVKTTPAMATSPPQYQQQPYQAQQARPNNTSSSSTSAAGNHFVSSQDVWGGTALPAPILDTGFGAFGGASTTPQQQQQQQKKTLDDDPFQNIWN